MIRTPVESSNVVSIGYEDNVLEVEFKGGVYRYRDVPVELYDKAMDANSKGQFINQHIKGVYEFEKCA